MSNVVAFPKAKKNTPHQSIEELITAVEDVRKEHVEYLIDDTLSFVFSRCYDEGFDLGKEESVKTSSMLVETLRSALYSTCGLHHPSRLLRKRYSSKASR